MIGQAVDGGVSIADGIITSDNQKISKGSKNLVKAVTVDPHYVHGYDRADGTHVDVYWRDGDGDPL